MRRRIIVGRTRDVVRGLLKGLWQIVCYHISDHRFSFFAKGRSYSRRPLTVQSLTFRSNRSVTYLILFSGSVQTEVSSFLNKASHDGWRISLCMFFTVVWNNGLWTRCQAPLVYSKTGATSRSWDRAALWACIAYSMTRIPWYVFQWAQQWFWRAVNNNGAIWKVLNSRELDDKYWNWGYVKLGLIPPKRYLIPRCADVPSIWT